MKSKHVGWIWSGLLGGMLNLTLGVTILNWEFYVLILIPILGSRIEREQNTYFWFVIHSILLLFLCDISPVNWEWWVLTLIPGIGVVIERELKKKRN